MTHPSAIPSVQVHGTSLHADFGDRVVGPLGGRSVQVLGTGAPRVQHAAPPDTRVLSRVQGLAGRVLDAITPHGVRAESKVRAGLEATSREVGALLQALSHRPGQIVDGLAARRILDGLATVAAPVTSRGASYDQVFQARVQVHLSHMGLDDLQALQQGLDHADQSALRSDAVGATHLAVLRTMLQQEQVQRLLAKAELDMLPVLEKSTEAVGQGRDAVSYHYDTLYGIANELLKQHGQDDSRDMARALIKEVLGRLVDDGRLDLGQTGAMIRTLPSRELRELLDTATTIGGEVPFTTERLLTGSVGVRAELSEQGFLAAADRLLAHREPAAEDPTGPLHAPGAFVQELVDAATHLAELREHNTVHHLHGSPQVDERFAALNQHLEELLRPSNLMLGELNHAQLHRMQKALQVLGVERCDTAIATAVQQRKDAAVQAFGAALHSAFDGAARGDLSAMCQALSEAHVQADQALQTFQRLGERIDDTDKIMQFRDGLVNQVVRGLPLQTLGTLFAQLQGPQGQALANALTEIGMSLLPGMASLEGRDVERGKQMFDMGIDLHMLSMAVQDELRRQGVSLPPLPDEAEYGVEHLGDAGHTALRDVFGVDASAAQGVRLVRGMAERPFQASVASNVHEVHEQPFNEQVLNGVGLGVSTAFWLDFPRATYRIQQPGGDVVPLLDREALRRSSPTETMDRLGAGVAALQNALGGDAALVQRVTQVANQNALMGLERGLFTPHSPLTLPNGSRGALPPSEYAVTYTVASDGEGGATVRMDYALSSAALVDAVTGETTALDPAHNRAQFSFTVHLGADGSVRLSDPVRYSYDIQPQE